MFICSFLLFAPLFGYLGDRYNRKYIMIVGLIVWTLTSFCCSFVTESVGEEQTVVVLLLYLCQFLDVIASGLTRKYMYVNNYPNVVCFNKYACHLWADLNIAHSSTICGLVL